MRLCVCYHAVGLYVGSLQGDGYTVQEDEEEDDIVEHLVTYDLLTPQPEPEEKIQKVSRRFIPNTNWHFLTSPPSFVLRKHFIYESLQTRYRHPTIQLIT